MLRKSVLLSFLYFSITVCPDASVPTFITVKKKVSEKPSAVKEEIISSLKDLLTCSSNLLTLIAQKQHLIIQTMENLAHSEGQFVDPTIKELQKLRNALQKMVSEAEEELMMIEQQCEQFRTVQS